jgi:rhodanese-related sulfurtransferase
MSDGPVPGTELSPSEVAEMLERDVEVIDVRTAEEHEAGHMAVGRHIELAQLASQAETIPKDRPVVFVCRVGNRSGMATEVFRGAGYDAYNLAGGLVAWVQSGLPLEPADGRVLDR